jgi:hypothetical protein
LKYCIHSIFKFAPWIRNIFIITDNQVPHIIEELQGTEYAKRIVLVDHTTIFEGLEKYLPTFNSLTIESVLWRIPDLSEHFIYFNDDFFLISSVEKKDFFTQDGVVVRGEWKVQSDKKMLRFIFKRKNALNNLYRRVQERSAELAGYSRRFFSMPHVPIALRKKTLESICIQKQECFLENLNFPFRDFNQFWMLSLAQQIEIKNKHVHVDNRLIHIYIHFPLHSNKEVLQKLQTTNATFICVQSLDLADADTRSFVFQWLHEKIF